MNSKRRKNVVVTAGVIRYEDEILIAQRKSDSLFEANKWEFAGGKLEFGEVPEQCLRREIKEELNLEIEVGEIFKVCSHVYRNRDIELHVVLLVYLAKALNKEFELVECQNAKWVRIDELKDYEFVIADVAIVQKIIEKGF